MVGYIYLITDTTNGMKYTGKHHYHIEGQLDPNYHGSGVIIKNIYKKRPETLKEEYIKTCYSEEEMNSDEQYYIKVFKTLWPNGYNLTEGGEGCAACEEIRKKISESNKGKTLSEEHRRKLSEAHKGKKLPEEQKKKISEALKGKNIWMKGKHLSEETKKKMSESLKGRPSGMLGKKHSEETKKKMSEAHKNGKQSKKVLQLSLSGELIREWSSTSECGRNGFKQSSVAACCRGERKTHKGFRWEYE